jgi:LysM repeat protein/lysophospholipase L1-like esterase
MPAISFRTTFFHFLSIFAVVVLAPTALFGQNNPNWPDLSYTPQSFLHPELNNFQFYQRDALSSLFQKLANSENKKVTLLHLGDAAAMADQSTREVRDFLQGTFGNGGRGMVFPYAVARCLGPSDYSSSATGKWMYAKNIEPAPEFGVGVHAVSIKTLDSIASITMTFQQTAGNRLRIFLKKDSESFDFTVTAGAEVQLVTVTKQVSDNGYIDLTFKNSITKFHIQVKKTQATQKHLLFYGFSLENTANQGVVYHCSGMNGTSFMNYVNSSEFAAQVKAIQPDAVILDLGFHEFWKTGLRQQEYYEHMKKMAEVLRANCPGVSIIFSNAQDIIRGGYPLPDGGTASDLTAQFCKTNLASFYDWYWIAGGKNSMRQWNSSNLAASDLMHLNAQGYLLKGQLMAEAWFKTYDWFIMNDTQVKWVHNIDTLLIEAAAADTAKKDTSTGNGWIYHTVKSGQSLWSIASTYQVTGAQIREWNKMKGNYIFTGQVLKIYTRLNIPAVATATTPADNSPKPIKPVKPKGPAPLYHKVKSGETLYGIAQKHKTTVANIKRLNNMRGTTIKKGQVLRVK